MTQWSEAQHATAGLRRPPMGMKEGVVSRRKRPDSSWEFWRKRGPSGFFIACNEALEMKRAENIEDKTSSPRGYKEEFWVLDWGTICIGFKRVPDKNVYTCRAVHLIKARLDVYNKRCPGEIEEMWVVYFCYLFQIGILEFITRIIELKYLPN